MKYFPFNDRFWLVSGSAWSNGCCSSDKSTCVHQRFGNVRQRDGHAPVLNVRCSVFCRSGAFFRVDDDGISGCGEYHIIKTLSIDLLDWPQLGMRDRFNEGFADLAIRNSTQLIKKNKIVLLHIGKVGRRVLKKPQCGRLVQLQWLIHLVPAGHPKSIVQSWLGRIHGGIFFGASVFLKS